MIRRDSGDFGCFLLFIFVCICLPLSYVLISYEKEMDIKSAQCRKLIQDGRLVKTYEGQFVCIPAVRTK